MSKIEWTNKTWNPVTGCDKVSQGCKNCYAQVMHKRLMGIMPAKYSKPFLGNIETHIDELSKPLHWKKPCMIFVNSMSDLFHKDVPFEFIDKVFDTMDAASRHTFQIATKRADRMKEYYQWKANGNGFKFEQWPLKNVWLIVSCEDQNNTDRIKYLLECPSVVHGVSLEPLLGPIYIKVHLQKQQTICSCDTVFAACNCDNYCTSAGKKNGITWVIAGGESGHHARPMHPDWVRSLRDQCASAGVPFFFKQWGEFVPFEDEDRPHGYMYSSTGTDDFDNVNIILTREKVMYAKVGKKKSGNFLDGKQHLEFPTGNRKLATV